MEKINVTGMSCASCSARVEKVIAGVEGVTSCNVNLLTGVAAYEGDVSSDAVKAAIIHAGYGVDEEREEPLPDEAGELKIRLVLSVVLTIPIMVLCFGLHSYMWLQCLLALAVIFINRKYFDSGIRSVLNRAPNMDTLVTLGSLAGFFSAHFDCAAMILALITIGKYLEAKNKGKATDALRGLIEMTPKTALVVRDGREQIIPVKDVVIGDTFLIKPGEAIPVDGVVAEGVSAVNESSLTGESMPADKGAGDEVSQGTINTWGTLRCTALRVGSETTLSKVIAMVQDAAATKAPAARIADKVAGIFVPVVIGLALITFFIWMGLIGDWERALDRAIAVLVISCPCALGLATPVAIMAGSGKGARNGILFKTAAALEDSGRISIVALDKTGTITVGEPVVRAVSGDEELLDIAYALEHMSEHPLARAITEYCKDRGEPLKAEDLRVMAGSGITAVIDGREAAGASYTYFSERGLLDDVLLKEAEGYAAQGMTPMVFSYDSKILGIIAVSDTIKEDSVEAVERLEDMGIRVVMLTGDNERTAGAIAEKAGITEYRAGLKPGDKNSCINELKAEGRVAMVGDGINDAPALTSADIGMAIGAGADIAIDAADVVLIKNSLADVGAALKLGRFTLRNIHQNIGWAFVYNIIGIPIAAGVFGFEFDPAIAAGCMSLSSICVVTNALRINTLKLYNRRDTKKMEKTMEIKGMMCTHCEATVKKALESIPGVISAEPSHEKGTAVITMKEEVSDELLKKAVVEAGYEVA